MMGCRSAPTQRNLRHRPGFCVHIKPYHIAAFRPAASDSPESAEWHLPQELLQSENDRLRAENATLKSALRAAGNMIGPYITPQKGEPPRR